MNKGYTGKYCIINLTEGSKEIVELGDDFYKKYLSGYGLGAAVITERQKIGIDPLSPNSYLGFCSGLLTGTGALFSGRFMVVGKSPLTGGWCDANVGGFFSRELKRTGYDAIFITGMSKKPVWVYINDGAIQIKDASTLWGKDTVETERIIKHDLNDQKVQVASIGISGEKISLISGIVTDSGRIAARSGLGAVMGSKKLKAIAVRGKHKIKAAHPDILRKINKEFLTEFKKSKFIDRLMAKFINLFSLIIAYTGISIPTKASILKEIYKQYGTSGLTVYSAMTGDTPIKNWIGSGYSDFSYENAIKISDKNVIAHQSHHYSCQSCPLGCGGIIDIKEGRYKGATGHRPEYETLAAFGSLLLHSNIDAIIEINEMCNRAGIDTISTGSCVAFAIECFEKAKIDKNITGGLDLCWGKTKEIVKLTDMIIHRDGFGDMLADGVKRASERIGKGIEKFAIHAGGQELPMHDSRLDAGYAIAYQCEPTPGRHTISCFLYADLFDIEKKFPKIKAMINNSKGKEARNVKRYAAGSFYMQIINCAGLCLIGALTGPLPVIEYINAVTGWSLTADEYLKTGERILNLRKAFNVREGIMQKDSKIPDRALGRPALKDGPLKGRTLDIESLQKEFFKTAGWDYVTGGPTREKMKELGIDYLF